MENDTGKAVKILTYSITFLAFFVIAGIWGITSLVRYEHQRDINTWQLTLNIMADSRVARIQQWTNSQFTSLSELAGNGSLQLYTQELLKHPKHGDYEPAQLSYLRNLIRASAIRYGFQDQLSTPPIPANVSHKADSGLALIAPSLEIITATAGMPILNKDLHQTINLVFKDGKPKVVDIVMADNKMPMVGFLQPVFALQMPTQTNKGAVAVLLAIKNASTSLFPLLASDAVVTKTDEALLVRRDKNLVTYVSSLADGTPPLTRQLAANSGDLAAAYALNHPGAFKQLRDYTGSEVLSTSRIMTGLPWILVQKITVAEALNESQRHQYFLYIILCLTLSIAAALLLAAWFYGSSTREHRITAELLAKSRQLTVQTHLLNTISDNIHDYIFLINFNSRLIFANRVLADTLNVPAVDLTDKTSTAIFGPAPADRLKPLLQDAQDKGAAIFQELTLEIKDKQTLFHVSCIPIPYQDTTTNDAILVTLHDITLLRADQNKKTNLLNQIVKALMRAIDLHDPYSTNHSANTAKIALAVGQAMNFTQKEQQVLETAANLCNIGKLSLPKELLAKTTQLTTSEEEQLRRETDFAKDILTGIDFDGPVLETIIQKNECMDGSGYPAGLRKEEIIRTAQVLAVSNAFVAMISPRAYRDKLSVKETLNELLTTANSKYNRQVVAALFHIADNEIDWNAW